MLTRVLCAAGLAASLAIANAAPEVDGLVTRPSEGSVEATIEKFEAAAKRRGFHIFARLDHAAAAASVGLAMPASTVIVFGNPRLGTPFFVQSPTLAIDLPLKALVWQDADGRVFLSYNSAAFVTGTQFGRHGQQLSRAAIEQLESGLAAIVGEAVQ